MKKTIFPIIIILILAAFSLYFINKKRIENVKTVKTEVAADYKNIEYTIDGNKIKLTDGYNASKFVEGSDVELITKYFGNELKTDLNGDGREDVAFIVTQNGGGTGTFYYVVGALNTDHGYVGSDGYLLGDRIAPQNINNSDVPINKNVIVANYADRDPSDAMTDAPHIGKSVYLKLDPSTMQWGVVANIK